MGRIATSLIALVLLAVPAHSEQVALVGFGFKGFQHEDGPAEDFSTGGFGIDYLSFGEENNLFFGVSLAAFEGHCGGLEDCSVRGRESGDLKSNIWTIFSLSTGYDLENSLFTPYVSLSRTKLERNFTILKETSKDTSLGLGTYIGKPGLRGYAALLGIGADELSFAVGAYRTTPKGMVIGGSYEKGIDGPLNSWTMNLRIGYSL